MAAIAGYKADLSIASGVGTTFSNEATSTADLTTYQITDVTKRYWDLTTALTVQTSPDGVTWTTVTNGFQVGYAGGLIIFPAAQAVGTQVRVSGKYLAIS